MFENLSENTEGSGLKVFKQYYNKICHSLSADCYKEMHDNSLVMQMSTYCRESILAIRPLSQTQNNFVKYYALQFACKT
jgi:hypothetical protein